MVPLLAALQLLPVPPLNMMGTRVALSGPSSVTFMSETYECRTMMRSAADSMVKY